MKVKISKLFYLLLNEIIIFIAKDKPIAARKFKKELILAIKKDLQHPFHYKKSIYFDDENHRDYTFKGYTITYLINQKTNTVTAIGIIKNKNSY